jgi:GNAT superfamily N-acetyltransferase
MSVALSEIDRSRFGMTVARAGNVTNDNLAEILAFCGDNHVAMLIARCYTTNLDTVQAMEDEGFRLMDTLVYYSFDFGRSEIPADTGVTVRPIKAGEDGAVKAVAARSFEGYYGHYHADPRLDKIKADEAYVDWAVRSCVLPEVADEVLVADLDGQIVGFATLRMNNPEEGEGVLFGVDPVAQGRGIYRSFMVGGMNWSKAQGAKRMVVSTQITNIAVQKVWARVGFTLSSAYYTFHKWFDS